MRRAISTALFFMLLLPVVALAQPKFGIYGNIGGMYYLGDLKETALPDIRTVKLTYGGGLTYQAGEIIGLQLNYLRGKLEGDDAYAIRPARRNRNLRFLSTIDDISFRVTVNFVREYPPRLIPYAIVGVGMFHFNPTHNGVPLQPLGTEGQGVPGYPAPYPLWQVNVPGGLGIKYRWCRWAVKLEAVYHKLFTDYLDDVSDAYPDPSVLSSAAAVYYSNPAIVPNNRAIRGNPTRKDSWIDLNLGVVFYFGRCGLDNARMLEDCEDLYKDLHDIPQ